MYVSTSQDGGGGLEECSVGSHLRDRDAPRF